MLYPQGQTLLIDADDTLWENNIYFERAIAAFISFLDHQEHTPFEVRERLNEVERQTVRERGYGLKSFQHSLVTCFEQLSRAPITDVAHKQIVSFARMIGDAEMQLLDGVAEAIPMLASRHRLILMTKGAEVEQADKLSRSGLARYFSAVEVPREKDVEAYREVIARYDLEPNATWMIGNSPRSDINPALGAGLSAVFVYHPDTWVLEHDTLAAPGPGQTLLEVASFAELPTRF